MLKKEEKDICEPRKVSYEQVPNSVWMIRTKGEHREMAPLLPWKITSARWGLVWVQRAKKFHQWQV